MSEEREERSSSSVPVWLVVVGVVIVAFFCIGAGAIVPLFWLFGRTVSLPHPAPVPPAAVEPAKVIQTDVPAPEIVTGKEP